MSEPLVEIRMREKCSTCAFRQGSEANADKVTQLKVRLCSETGSQFLCHESEREAMCAGFHDLLLNRIHQKSWQETPEWKRELGVQLLNVLNAAEKAQEPFEPSALVKKAVEAVGQGMQSGESEQE